MRATSVRPSGTSRGCGGSSGAKQLPVALCAPAASDIHRTPIVQGGYSAVLSLPAAKRMVFNTLYAFTAADQADGVVFISDYLKRREGVRRLKVLVADDNAVNRTVLAKILERANHELTLVESGEEVARCRPAASASTSPSSIATCPASREWRRCARYG